MRRHGDERTRCHLREPRCELPSRRCPAERWASGCTGTVGVARDGLSIAAGRCGLVPTVINVCRDGTHRLSKVRVDAVTLLAGLGIVGDAHAGVTVQHRSRVAADPTQPNLRQVHLKHAELFDELREQGFDVRPGQLGENITTKGLDLLALSRGTQLRIGTTAVVEVTGLRNPCAQIDGFKPGLLKAVVHRAADGLLVRRAGIMAVVRAGGDICPGDLITGLGRMRTCPPQRSWTPSKVAALRRG